MITFDSVSKSYEDNRVLDNLSFTIASGERVALIGPSGSGKTTILRTIMTLETIDEGKVEVNGNNLWDASEDAKLGHRELERKLKPIRDGVGMVFQQFNLFPNMTAEENVAAPLRYVRRQSRDGAVAGAREILERMGLGSRMHAYPHELSGGQQQRVAIARSLALEPEVMLFDEVTSALDPELVGEVLETLRDLAASTVMTMLLVTHEMRFAADFADRVFMFDRGKIVEAGPAKQLLSNPIHVRTKAFLQSTGGE